MKYYYLSIENMFSKNVQLFLTEIQASDPCYPSPCGPNAVCDNGVCNCQPEYHGDPYFECRPECTISSECPMDKTCAKHRCVDPCINTCGVNAICQVVSHMAVCTCPSRTTGNAFIQCNSVKGKYLNKGQK